MISSLPIVIITGLFCFLPTDARWHSAFVVPTTAFQAQRQRRQASLGQCAIPPGRVEDIHEWVRLSCESLERFTGTSLLKVMNVDTMDAIHDNTRYAVLSHGNQTDPIYNYFNKAALLQFEYPEEEIYLLPSRYSAPPALRQDRDEKISSAVQQNVQFIPSAIRQGKSGKQFELINVTLWNVYNERNERVGQSAVFDRNLIVELDGVPIEQQQEAETLEVKEK